MSLRRCLLTFNSLASRAISFALWGLLAPSLALATDLKGEPIISRPGIQGRQIVVDTWDEDSCRAVKAKLTNLPLMPARGDHRLHRLCTVSLGENAPRFRTITLMWDNGQEFRAPINIDFLRDPRRSLSTDTRNLSYLMVATMGVLWVLPESVSKWNKVDIRKNGLSGKWGANVKGGPVWDTDDPWVNYIGHPVAGAIYYTVGRANGLSQWQSFGYTVMMSTFFWEYGIEALAEKPSIQDLIVTPVVGALMGEAFISWTEKIHEQNDTVLGSKRLGRATLFVLDPVGSVSKSINHFLERPAIQSSRANFVFARKKNQLTPEVKDNYIGIDLNFVY